MSNIKFSLPKIKRADLLEISRKTGETWHMREKIKQNKRRPVHYP